MGKKEGGGGKKAKGPALDASEEAVAVFGFKLNELVRTPLGLQGTVIGVKCEEAGVPESAHVWVRYANGHEAPLEPRQSAGQLSSLGYRRCPEADHIKRDVTVQESELLKLEQQRRVVAEVVRLKAAGLPIPEHLLPASAGGDGASAKAGGDKGDKKAKK